MGRKQPKTYAEAVDMMTIDRGPHAVLSLFACLLAAEALRRGVPSERISVSVAPLVSALGLDSGLTPAEDDAFALEMIRDRYADFSGLTPEQALAAETLFRDALREIGVDAVSLMDAAEGSIH